MKTNLTFLFLFSFFCCLLNAQSFNYEDVSVKYKLAARTPFTTQFKTVSVRFLGEEQLKKYGILPSDLTANEFKFERYKNVKEKGDLHLDVFVGKPEYLGVEKQTDKRNGLQILSPEGKHLGTIITPIHYELRDGARELIEEKVVYAASDHLHFKSDYYKSSYELTKAWEESKNIKISKHITNMLQFSLGETAKAVRDRFDDQVISDKVNLFDIKKAEKIKAEFINTAFLKITTELASNPMMSDWSEAKKTEIKDLLTKGTKFSAEDNDERVAFAIAHFDLALLNAMWGNIDVAKKHLAEGRRADRKQWEFDQLQKLIVSMDGRGVSDEISSKAYVGTYQEGADAKLAGAPPASSGSPVGGEDYSDKPARTLDTVYAKNGDMIIGYMNAVHVRKKFMDSEMYDFSHLLINPTNMPQEEIRLNWDEISYLKHKNVQMAPQPTKVAMVANPPIHLYKLVKASKDQKLGLLRTAYHESMPYVMNGTDYEIYQFSVISKTDPKDVELLNVCTGAKYALGINGGLKKDFETCPAILRKAEAKTYKAEEESLKGLIDDYDSCNK